MVFSDEQLNKVNEIIKRYPEGKQKSALLPVLHLAQQLGWWLAGCICYGLCCNTIKYQAD